MPRMTATDASRNFARMLDEVEHDDATFVIERHGRPVAEIRPAPRRHSLDGLLAALAAAPPDPAWADDAAAVLAARKAMPPRDRWDGG